MSSLLDNEPIPRRKMTLFFMIDKSGSMCGSKIASLNDAIENVLPMIGDISDANPDAEIDIAVLEFSTDCNWLYNEPRSAKDFRWQNVSADGLTSLGEACRELNKKLSRSNGFMGSPSGCYAPAIILLSDGGPTDNFEAGLDALKKNSWFKSAIKNAIAIGDDADIDVLTKFTGSPEGVIRVHNLEALKTLIKLVSITSSQIGSKSTSTTDTTKQDQVNQQLQDAITDIRGAESVVAPKADTTDNYDEWD